jgi:hypothetical protein
VTPVLAVFLALPMIFLGAMAIGYSQGFALAVRRHSSGNYRLRAGGDDHVCTEEKGVALLRSWLSPEQAELALETIEIEAVAKANRNRTFGAAQTLNPARDAARIVGDHGT